MNYAIAFCIILGTLAGNVVALDANWNSIAGEQHNLVYAEFGLDYGTTVRLGYARLLGAPVSTLLAIDVATPMGEEALDDFEVRLGTRIRAIEFRNLALSAEVFAGSRRASSNMVDATSLGAEVTVIAGYYRSKWHIAAEYGYDKAISTYLKHSDEMKTFGYAAIHDGWYTATGGNFHYGIQGSKSVGSRIDITARAGMTNAEGKDENPMLPFYAQLGCIVRF